MDTQGAGQAGIAEQYLTFVVADEEYAVPLSRVREVVEFGAVTRLPAAAPFVRGVINRRGTIVPVLDLAVRFGHPPRAPTRRSCIVVLDVVLDGLPAFVGVMADAVRRLAELPPAAVEPPPAFGTAVRPEFLLGVSADGPRFLLLLDVDALLAASDFVLAAGAPECAEPSSESAAPDPARLEAAS